MQPMSHDPVVAALGAQMVTSAADGLVAGAVASGPVTAMAPAGAEEVSAQAVAAFAAEGVAVLGQIAAVEEDLTRAGSAVTQVARMYGAIDDGASDTLAR